MTSLRLPLTPTILNNSPPLSISLSGTRVQDLHQELASVQRASRRQIFSQGSPRGEKKEKKKEGEN